MPASNAAAVMPAITQRAGTSPPAFPVISSVSAWPSYYPFLMGREWAGQIVALGEGADDFEVGD